MSASTPYVLPFMGITPAIAGPIAHAGRGSAVLGRVTLGRNAWLGALSVIRADGHFVKVGDDFYLGPRSTLHIFHEILPCIVGDRVAVGRNACVHACTVGSDIAIGDGVVILDGATVDDNVVIEAGSTVFPNKHVPGGFLYAGSPARPVRALEPGEVLARREAIMGVADENTVEDQPPAVGGDAHIDRSAFIASTAVVTGRLVAAESSSVWFSNRLDAGRATITVGARTNIQDNTTIRCPAGTGVTIGEESTVGHNVIINDCVIGNRTLIGIGSTVAPGSTIGDRVLLAAAARTKEGQVLESGWLYAGNPARKFAPLDDAKQALTALIVRQYCQYAQEFAALERAAAGSRSRARG
ncbi:MAG TPA: gamma carbonic anhydrase family protein [Hyphomicrobiaceae bacterium]|nr:gamma carbonic anhydrase family protein [Hyphomicrobiaceae bacterium]